MTIKSKISVYNSKDDIGKKAITRVYITNNLDNCMEDDETYYKTKNNHKGITRLRTGNMEYVLISYVDIDSNIRGFGYIISDEEAYEEIRKSNKLHLLKDKKFKRLKEIKRG